MATAEEPASERRGFKAEEFGILTADAHVIANQENQKTEWRGFLDEPAPKSKASGIVICCCNLFCVLICISFPVLGVIFAVNAEFESKSALENTGYIFLLICSVVIAFLLCACCSLPCIGTGMLCMRIAEGQADDHEQHEQANYTFHHANRATVAYQKQHAEVLKSRANPLPKEVQGLLKEREKDFAAEKTVREKTAKQELIGSVKTDLESGFSPKEVRQKLRPKVYVLRFKPDAKDKPGGEIGDEECLNRLRVGISAVLAVASKYDELLLILSSPGGPVTLYGAAASQLGRVKNAGLRLTVCVDTIAASGGYMMACVAHRIIAAPFAIVGSIGVIAFCPNVRKLAEANKVDIHQITAGEYKRTVDPFGEVTEEKIAKMTEQVADIHFAFKEHIRLHRPAIANISSVATGEAWLAVQAKEYGLVDEIMTSDEYIAQRCKDADVLNMKYTRKQKTPPFPLGLALGANGEGCNAGWLGLVQDVLGMWQFQSILTGLAKWSPMAFLASRRSVIEGGAESRYTGSVWANMSPFSKYRDVAKYVKLHAV